MNIKVTVMARLATVCLAIIAGSAVAHLGAARDDEGNGDRDGYTVALFGDMPYNTLGRAQYPALLADINASKVAFSIFDGDLKAGGDGPCADTLYTTAIANFNTLERPLIWLPGDNDWTDCWGRYGPSSAPFFDPLERLSRERALFAATDRSLGRTTLTLTRQTAEGYPENVRWKKGPVVYIGLNVQGSNDNFPYAGVDGETRGPAEIARQRAEEVARKAADLGWLHQGFEYAARAHARGVMVIWQADPNFNDDQHVSDPRAADAFPDYVNALRAETLAFPGQVVLVHGDGHYFKMDKPINGPSDGVLANFTRVETFGARNTHWVSARIDPDNPQLFVFEPRIVAANTR
ncbi:MAG TPA: hypothetical protein VKD69_11780 [Vicinamibacterales bacterium]|nr:hypothetical protein [Vicinamibacterales bacterium]